METVYIYALAANLSFAVGVQFFTHYARRISSLWVNCFKALVAAALFAVTISLQGGFHPVGSGYAALFFVSGMLGLGLADVLLIKAFSLMGPGRTMMLFGFQPLGIGVFSYFAFGQAVDTGKIYAIFFFIVCLFIFSLESFKKQGHWNTRASFFALAAVSGIAITGTLFASVFECLVDRKPPSAYLLVSFAFFLAGMSFLF